MASINTLTARKMPLHQAVIKGVMVDVPDFEMYVERGAALLDERVPGWLKAVDLPVLDLSSGRSCVIGQLAIKSMLNGPLEGYEEGIGKLFKDARQFPRAAAEHGFNVPRAFFTWHEETDDEMFTTDWAFEELTRLWEAVIKARRRAARQTRKAALVTA